MFCPHCGTKNLEDAKFCASCGKPLFTGSTTGTTSGNNIGLTGSTMPSTSPAVGPDSYRQLGGWLAVLTYGLLVAVALIAIGAVLGGITLIKYAKYLGAGLLLLGLLDIALYIPVVYYCLKMFQMIKARDCMFLRFYEMTMLVLGGAHIVLMVIGAMSGYLSVGDHFKSLLEALIVFAIWMTYFTKSVRVRTYFGSDEYLKHSIILNLFKNHTL